MSKVSRNQSDKTLRRLQTQLASLKRELQISQELKLEWMPNDSPRSGEVNGNSIRIYEADEAKALDTLRHEFVESFARKCLDEGADAYLGHGAHMLQGIEIYKQRPIFYSLGNFIVQRDLVSKLPSDFYDTFNLGPDASPQDAFDARIQKSKRMQKMLEDPAFSQSIVAVCDFEDHKLHDLRLYPVELGLGKPRQQYGTPMLADSGKAKAIVERMARLSEPYGTKISFEQRVGVVSLP